MQRTDLTNLHLVPITSLPISHIQIQYLVSSFTILTPTNLDSHHDHCVLLAGKGSPELPSSQRNSVQYLSMYDNKVLRKFRGHTDAITDISMSPAEDTFLTSSRDRTVRYVVRGMPSKGTLLRLNVLLAVCAWSGPDICLFDLSHFVCYIHTNRLWDVQQAGCLAQMELPSNTEGNPHAVFDSTGLVFAVIAGISGGAGHVRTNILALWRHFRCMVPRLTHAHFVACT